MVGALALSPLPASAALLDFLGKTAHADSIAQPAFDTDTSNSQRLVLPENTIGPDSLSTTKDVAPVATPDQKTLVAEVGPLGTASDMADMPITTSGITFYTVHAGDTASSVATMFGISKATLLAANGLKSGDPLKLGSVLTILPVSGSEYTVKKGDTIAGIANKYKADANDIAFYNDIGDDSELIAGDTIVIPDDSFAGNTDATGDSKPSTKTSSKSGKASSTKNSPSTKSSKGSSGTPVINADGLAVTNSNGTNTSPITVHPLKDYDKVDLGTDLLRPVALGSSRESQGAHGWNNTAVDLAAPLGTPIMAAASGTVSLARTGGYNGGYGNYVILTSVVDGHTVQTIYGHMSKVLVSSGQTVSRGQTIGLVGRTGDATGYHLHFEVRGAANPLQRNPSYTGE